MGKSEEKWEKVGKVGIVGKVVKSWKKLEKVGKSGQSREQVGDTKWESGKLGMWISGKRRESGESVEVGNGKK